MSNPESVTAEQQFFQLSGQYKKPLRIIMGEAEEAVQNTISNLIQQSIQMNNALKNSNQEIQRLQKLLTDNNVSFTKSTEHKNNT